MGRPREVNDLPPPRSCVGQEPRLCVCHQIRPLNPQRNSLRSLTFARFARTFVDKLNLVSCLNTDHPWSMDPNMDLNMEPNVGGTQPENGTQNGPTR